MEVEQSNRDEDGVSLPEEIIFDVLARLPAKALCRFRCVSKAWRALISDPTFVSAQRSGAGPHLVGVFFRSSRLPPEVQVMDMDGNVVRLLEVGLLGKHDVLGVLQQQATTTTTRLNVIVYREQAIGARAMIIDPAAGCACTVDLYTLQSSVLSFGCATPSGALKLLRLDENPLRNEQLCTFATIVGGGGVEPLRWRRRSAPPFVTSWCPQRRSTVNGIVYFMPPRLDDVASPGLHRIAAFDLESEEWKMINGPALGIEKDAPYISSLTEHRGTLGFVQSLRERNNVEHNYTIIWLLIDYNRCVWVKKNTIQMPKTWELNKQLGALDDGRILLLVKEWETIYIYFDHRDVLIFCNPSTKTFTEFRDRAAIRVSDILVLYNGSLLS